MESSIGRNPFFISPLGNHTVILSYTPALLVRMTVTQYTTTLHLSFPLDNKLGKALKNETQHVIF